MLTYALLQGLTNREADKDGNKKLWEREWFDYAVNQVPQLQLEAMKQRNADLKRALPQVKGRAEIVYENGDNETAEPEKRRVQTPRVFYRREIEKSPLVIAKP